LFWNFPFAIFLGFVGLGFGVFHPGPLKFLHFQSISKLNFKSQNPFVVMGVIRVSGISILTFCNLPQPAEFRSLTVRNLQQTPGYGNRTVGGGRSW
jgi:hypothetical protein